MNTYKQCAAVKAQSADIIEAPQSVLLVFNDNCEQWFFGLVFNVVLKWYEAVLMLDLANWGEYV